MTYAAAKFEAATPNGLGGDAFTCKYIILPLFDLDLGVKVTQDVEHHPLHHVTYSDTKFTNVYLRFVFFDLI